MQEQNFPPLADLVGQQLAAKYPFGRKSMHIFESKYFYLRVEVLL